MVEQVTFQTIFQFLQTVGILVGVFYYIMTIRTNQRNQELTRKAQETTLETRQAQLFMPLYETFRNHQYRKHWSQVMNLEWTDWEDFRERYVGATCSQPSVMPIFQSQMSFFEGIGVLVKKGLIDISIVYESLYTRAVDVEEEPTHSGRNAAWRSTLCTHAQLSYNLHEFRIPIRRVDEVRRGTPRTQDLAPPYSFLH